MKDRLPEKILYLKNINNIKNIKTLSTLINLPYSTLKDIIDGTSTNIRLNTARQICDFFDVTLDELLRDEINLPEFITDDNKNSVLKVKRKYPKPDYSEQAKKNEEAFKVASKYENEVIDLSKYDDDTKDLILKIVEMNKKQKKDKE